MARKILLADDSVTAQNMGRRILTDAGYELVTVNNGSAALKKIAEFKPDLIILDVYMPGHSGLEVCQRIKETRETERIPVLLSVGKLEPFKPEEARRVRADAFIVKPFEASELLTALTKLEDKIVPQPEAYKPGRFAQAMARAEEPAGFGDQETGWKDRLKIPSPQSKQAEQEPEAQQPSVAAHRDLDRGADFKPVETAAAFERPMPAGLPADITPEEIAAITSAAAAFGGKTDPAPTASTQEASTQETPAAAAEQEDVPSATFAAGAASEDATVETPQTVAAETEPIAQASAPDTQPQETQAVETPGAMEILAKATGVDAEPSASGSVKSDIPETTGSETVSPETEKKRAVSDPEVLAALASLGIPTSGDSFPGEGAGWEFGRSSDTGPMNVAAIVAKVEFAAMAAAATGPRWIAQPVPVPENEASLILEREMEKAYAAFAAADSAHMSFPAAPPAIVISGAIEANFPVVANPVPEAGENAPAAAEGQAEAAVEEKVEAQAEAKSEENAEAKTETQSEGQSTAAAEGKSETGAAEVAASETAASETATSETAPAAEVAAEGVAAETSSAAVAESSGENATAATDATVSITESSIKDGPEASDEKATGGAAYAAAAAAGNGANGAGGDAASDSTAVTDAVGVPAPSAEAAEATSTSGERKDTELVAAWDNWRQIRESIVGPQATAETTTAPVAESQAAEAEAAATGTSEDQTSEARTGAANEEKADDSASTHSAAHADSESAAASGEGDSPEIASIVDNMLAELKPKLMHELAKKMGNEKKKKKKRD